jgi:hypothetical protein
VYKFDAPPDEMYWLNEVVPIALQYNNEETLLNAYKEDHLSERANMERFRDKIYGHDKQFAGYFRGMQQEEVVVGETHGRKGLGSKKTSEGTVRGGATASSNQQEQPSATLSSDGTHAQSKKSGARKRNIPNTLGLPTSIVVPENVKASRWYNMPSTETVEGMASLQSGLKANVSIFGIKLVTYLLTHF